jgi:CDP-paratose 2-epimerase
MLVISMTEQKEQTILITGGLGFIGSHAAETFVREGYNVVVIDNLSRPQPNIKERDNLPYIWQYLEEYYPQIRKIKLDVRDRQALYDIFQEILPDIVLHAAGQTSAVGSVKNPQADFENNVEGLYNTLEISRNIGTVKDFIFLSTNKVYGERVNALPIEETDAR